MDLPPWLPEQPKSKGREKISTVKDKRFHKNQLILQAPHKQYRVVLDFLLVYMVPVHVIDGAEQNGKPIYMK